VAASTSTPVRPSKPSISVSSWLSVWSRSSLKPGNVTQRALSVTQRALSVTQRELSASPSESSSRHPARALRVTQRELFASPSKSSSRHPARALRVTQRELFASPSKSSSRHPARALRIHAGPLTCAALAADGVQLVDEHHGRRLLARRREELPNARGPPPDEHLHELAYVAFPLVSMSQTGALVCTSGCTLATHAGSVPGSATAVELSAGIASRLADSDLVGRCCAVSG
jgi:hypothetical protein